MTDNTELIGCVSHDCAVCKERADALEAYHTDEVMRGLMLEKAHAVILAKRDALQAEVAHKSDAIQKLWAERDSALARLAAIESQVSVATVLLHEGEKIIDGTMAFMDTAWLGMPLYAAAGASPQPASAFKKLSDSEVIWLAQSHGIEGNPLSFYAHLISTQPVQPSQALEVVSRLLQVHEDRTLEDARKIAAAMLEVQPSQARELSDEEIDALWKQQLSRPQIVQRRAIVRMAFAAINAKETK